MVCLALGGALASVPAALGARPLTATSKGLVAGSTAVTSCGTLSTVVANFSISGSTVTSVSLSNFPAACNGASVKATVASAGTSLGQGGPVTIASGAAAVPISPAAATASVTHVRLVVTGP